MPATKKQTATKKAAAAPKKKVTKKAPATVVEPEVKPRRKAEPVTVETYQARLDELITYVDEQINQLKSAGNKGVKGFKHVRKVCVTLRDKAPKLAKQKRKKSENAKSGFKIPYLVSDELCKFLKLPNGSAVTRVDATRGITVYANLKDDEARPAILKWKHLNAGGKRNLQSPEDKTVIVPDASLKKLLRYNQYVKDVKAGKITKRSKNKETGKMEQVVVKTPELKYYTIQKLIQPHFKEKRRVDEELEAE